MTSVNRLSEAQVAALRCLADVWPDVPVCLIGGAALQCHYERFWRPTADLDLTLTATTEDLQRLRDRPGWRQIPEIEHRWCGPADVWVDLIPVSSSQLQAGEIIWPKSELRMNLVGYRLVFERALQLQLGLERTIRIAPPEVICLLKMSSHHDYPHDRIRDLMDIAFILEEYLPPDDNRRFSYDEIPADVSYHATAAFALARDLAAISNNEERLLVQSWLAKMRATDEFPGVAALPFRWRSEWLFELIATFARGFTQPTRQRPVLEIPSPMMKNGGPSRER
jgi:predicted nucleotidyltransferase